MAKNEGLDLTEGNLFIKLIKFALPFIATNLLSLFYTTADLLTVGRFGDGKTSMSAVGSNNALIILISAVFLGFSMGANVVVANCKGKKDKEQTFKAVHSSIALALISGVILTIVGCVSSRYLLLLMQIKDEVILSKATTYLTIFFAGSLFNMIYNFGASILRAYGDSKRPLFALLFAGIFNVGLNLLLVIVFKLDVIGVGIATIVSQAVSAVAVMYFLIRDKNIYVNISLKSLKLYKNETKEIIRVGLGVTVTNLAFNFANVLLQSSINSLGAVATIGCSASSNIEGYLYYTLNGIAMAAMSMVSQNYGANKKKNCKKTLLYACLIQLVVGLVVGTMLSVFSRQILSLLIDKTETDYLEIIETGRIRMIMVVSLYFLCGWMDSLCAYYRGLKFSIVPTLISFVFVFGMRVIFMLTLFIFVEQLHDVHWLMFTYPSSWILTIIVYIAVYPYMSKKAFEKLEKNSDKLSEKKA